MQNFIDFHTGLVIPMSKFVRISKQKNCFKSYFRNDRIEFKTFVRLPRDKLQTRGPSAKKNQKTIKLKFSSHPSKKSCFFDVFHNFSIFKFSQVLARKIFFCNFLQKVSEYCFVAFPQCFTVRLLVFRPDIVIFVKTHEMSFCSVFWKNQKSLKSH